MTYSHADPKTTGAAQKTAVYDALLVYLNAEKSNSKIFTYYTGIKKDVSIAVTYLSYLEIVKAFITTPTKSFANYITDFNTAKLVSDDGTTYDTIVAALKTDSYLRMVNGFASSQLVYPKQTIVMSAEPPADEPSELTE